MAMRRLLLAVLLAVVVPIAPAAAAADACLVVLECEEASPNPTTSPAPAPAPAPTTTTTAPPPPPAPAADPAAELLALANAARADAGVAPLRASADAADVARGWSESMASSGVLAHNDAWFTPAVRSRLGARRLGENVAYAGSISQAHATLLASPGHRANLLDAGFTVVGMAAVLRDGRWWVTQDFAEVPQAPDAPAPEPARTAPARDLGSPRVAVPPPVARALDDAPSEAARWVARAAAQRSWDSASSSIRWR